VDSLVQIRMARELGMGSLEYTLSVL